MELHIIDTSWGVDRRNGRYGESEAANVVFQKLKVGPLPPIGPARHVFKIEEIKENSIVLFLSERAGSVEISMGKPYDYRPLSMDGGHYYKIILE
ncbi:MAG: hypothetical protein J5736_05790 [Bacilli bacterium]|nr:hypothetical protein [Bacilli bacterium]